MKKLVLLIIIVTAGLFYYIKADIDLTSSNIAALPSLPTAEIVRGTISSVISGRGKIVPNRRVPVNSFIDGQITQILVRQGQEVKKGQCLVKLDVEPGFKFRIFDLKQKFIANDYNQKHLKKKIDFQLKLYKEGLTALVEIEELEKNIKWAEMERQALNNERLLLEKQFGFALTMSSLLNNELDDILSSCIQSAITGTVLQINKKTDDIVFSNSDFNRATIMVIADISKYFIDYKVSEFDLDKIQEGQQVEITVDSMPKKLFYGIIETISSMAIVNIRDGQFTDTSRETSHYTVKISIADATPELRPDLSCRISIKTATRPNVLMAPVTSIFTGENRQQFVFVQKNEEYERRNVQVGIANTSMIEIQAGLAEGEVVCLDPHKIIEHRKIIKAAASRTLIEKILH